MRRVGVGFDGPGAGVGELSWGQAAMWATIVRERSWLPMGGVRALPPDTTVADVVAELSWTISRHPAMRTRLRFADDGRPLQVVAGAGQTHLDIVDAGADDPAEVARAVEAGYRAGAHDFVDEWPVRMTVVRRGGTCTHLVVIMTHLVTDGMGAALMLAEAARRPTAPPAGLQPLDQARWQRSPAGRRQSDAALRYWERHLSAAPAAPWGAPVPPHRPRYHKALVRSPALHLAVRAIGARTGTDSPAVLLTVFAAALYRITGVHPVAVWPLVGNRFRAGLAATVSPVAQNGLCVVDLAGGTFDQGLDRVRRAALGAYKYAYYDPDRLDALTGAAFVRPGRFNDRRIHTRAAVSGPPPTAAQIGAARPATTVTWLNPRDTPLDPFFVHLDDVTDAIAMTLDLDTAHLAPADALACVHAMEELAVRAAFDPAVPVDRPGAPARPAQAQPAQARPSPGPVAPAWVATGR